MCSQCHCSLLGPELFWTFPISPASSHALPTGQALGPTFKRFLMVRVLFLPQGLEFLPCPQHSQPFSSFWSACHLLRGFRCCPVKTSPPPFISILILYLVYLHNSIYYICNYFICLLTFTFVECKLHEGRAMTFSPLYLQCLAEGLVRGHAIKFLFIACLPKRVNE